MCVRRAIQNKQNNRAGLEVSKTNGHVLRVKSKIVCRRCIAAVVAVVVATALLIGPFAFFSTFFCLFARGSVMMFLAQK